MTVSRYLLLAALADGKPHHVHILVSALHLSLPQLDKIRKSLPRYLSERLRRRDGYWQLDDTFALLAAEDAMEIGKKYGFSVEVLPETESTNTLLADCVREEGAEAVEKRLVVAYKQTAGRGRQGRRWEAETGSCLMFSMVHVFGHGHTRIGALAPVTALAVCRALQDVGIAAQIKWPNDIVIGDKKLGGILIESLPSGGNTAVVTGIGLNFVVPEEMTEAAGIRQYGPQVLVKTLFDRLAARLTEAFSGFAETGMKPFLEEYRRFHRDTGRNVCLLREGTVIAQGLVYGISDQGGLQLQSDGIIREYVSGEISLRPSVTSVPAENEPDTLPTPASDTEKAYLFIDAGNSKLKWAWVSGGVIRSCERASYSDLSELSAEWLRHGNGETAVYGCAVCGPEKILMVETAFPGKIHWLSSEKQALGIYNHYRNIAEHGADRWFNVLGSRRFTRNACVVVSCGTAVTIDALTSENHYLGGSILPGFYLMKESLARRTANLNRSLGKAYPFATTTPNALAAGISDAVGGAVILMHKRLKEKNGANNPVDILLTGGGAGKVTAAMPAEFTLDNHIEIVDNLVIYGLLNRVENA